MRPRARLLPSCAVFVSLAFVVAGRLSAQHEETPGFVEPLQDLFLTETVYPQRAREIQVTSDFRFHRGATFDLWSAALLLEFGLTDRLQLAGEIPYESLTPGSGPTERGFGRPALALMFAIRPPGHGVALSAELAAELPSLAHGAGEEVEWELGAVAAFAVGEVVVHGGVDLELADEAEPVLSFSIFRRLGPVIPALELIVPFADDDAVLLTPGLVWGKNAFEVAVGVPLGLSDAAPQRSFVVKLTWEFDL